MAGFFLSFEFIENYKIIKIYNFSTGSKNPFFIYYDFKPRFSASRQYLYWRLIWRGASRKRGDR